MESPQGQTSQLALSLGWISILDSLNIVVLQTYGGTSVLGGLSGQPKGDYNQSIVVLSEQKNHGTFQDLT